MSILGLIKKVYDFPVSIAIEKIDEVGGIQILFWSKSFTAQHEIELVVIGNSCMRLEKQPTGLLIFAMKYYNCRAIKP